MLSASDLVSQMSDDMGMLPAHINTIIRTAPLRYKVFYIPKKSGGMREIAQPAREIKAIQRWFVEKLVEQIPVHSAATAYKEGASIKNNAIRHVKSNYLLKMDFKDFFPSITMEDICQHLERYCSAIYDRSAMRLVAYVCTWAPNRLPPLRLCIGAPSSPLLSNSILFEFDERLSEKTRADGVEYTRYADDITLSSDIYGVLDAYPKVICNMTEEMEYPTLRINSNKTVFASRAGRRVVTGLTLTPDYNLSIGRERKRLIRAMYHRYETGRLSPEEEQKLFGLLAFADEIEPGFSSKLKK